MLDALPRCSKHPAMSHDPHTTVHMSLLECDLRRRGVGEVSSGVPVGARSLPKMNELTPPNVFEYPMVQMRILAFAVMYIP